MIWKPLIPYATLSKGHVERMEDKLKKYVDVMVTSDRLTLNVMLFSVVFGKRRIKGSIGIMLFELMRRPQPL